MKKQQTLLLIGGAFGAFMIGGGLYASPYITLYQMYQAVEHHDLEGIASHVDFLALRSSVKLNLQVIAQKEMVKQNPLMRLIGSLIGGVMLDSVIDRAVSPEGIAALLEGQKLQIDDQGENQPQSAQRPAKAAAVDVKAQYESFDQFAVDVKPKGDTVPVTLLLSREGLEWKLSGVRLPGT
jgi:1-acyl-sn-glycerol-3-phosphate acyltransferase